MSTPRAHDRLVEQITRLFAAEELTDGQWAECQDNATTLPERSEARPSQPGFAKVSDLAEGGVEG